MAVECTARNNPEAFAEPFSFSIEQKSIMSIYCDKKSYSMKKVKMDPRIEYVGCRNLNYRLNSRVLFDFGKLLIFRLLHSDEI